MFREIEDPKEAYEFHTAGLLWCLQRGVNDEVPHPCVPQWDLVSITGACHFWHWLICIDE